jgi:hypothetical protein
LFPLLATICPIKNTINNLASAEMHFIHDAIKVVERRFGIQSILIL